MKLSLFVTLCNIFFQKDPKRINELILSYFVIKTVISKNADSIHIHCLLFPKQSEEEGTITNC